MRHLLRLTHLSAEDFEQIFALADAYARGEGPKIDGAAALFFPPSSIRTRASFERGLFSMGLQPLVFPPESLDKPEALRDVAGYLAQFSDVAVVRHSSIDVLNGLAEANALPIVNAMTSVNHPCEVLSDLWALKGRGVDIRSARYVVVGVRESNILRAWVEAGEALGLDVVQSCPSEYRLDGVPFEADLRTAVSDADVIITDPPGPMESVMK